MTPNWVAYIFGNQYISQEIKQLKLDEKQPFVEGIFNAESQILDLSLSQISTILWTLPPGARS